MGTNVVNEKAKEQMIEQLGVNEDQELHRCFDNQRCLNNTSISRKWTRCSKLKLLHAMICMAVASHVLQIQESMSVLAFLNQRSRSHPWSLSQRRIRKIGHAQGFVPRYYSSLEDCDKPLSDSLSFYSYNLQNHRSEGNPKTAKSLSYFLKANPINDAQNDSDLSPNLTRALILATRTAGEVGDYRLILHLVESSVEFANGNRILSPRVFGEALNALSQTTANASKVKRVWTLATSSKTILTHPLTAYELNIFMKALAKLGRIQSSITTLIRHTDEINEYMHIVPDAYTASTLFTILRDSISADQKRDEVLAPRLRLTDSALQSTLKEVSRSPAWQWNTAVDLLHVFDFEDFNWNNHAYSGLLKLHEKVAAIFPEHGNGSKITHAIVDDMSLKKIHLDEVTCALVVKCIGDPSRNRMAWKHSVDFLRRMSIEKTLPMPNAFAYSAAIVACARCSEYETALELLEEMRDETRTQLDSANHRSRVPAPNTWVYNAVLLAINDQKKYYGRHNPKRKVSGTTKGRVELAMQLFEQMKSDFQSGSENLQPDTVTYNTVLSIMGTETPPSEQSLISLLDEMVQNGTPRDAITYRNAILASPSGKRTRRLLLRCLDDDLLISKSSERLQGKAANAMTFIFNSALSTSASQGGLKDFTNVFSLMQERNIESSVDTISHLITILGRSGNSKLLPQLLVALNGGVSFVAFQSEVLTSTGISVGQHWLPRLSDTHYYESTTACLNDNNIADAHESFRAMKSKGIVPDSESAEGFAIAYARAASNIIWGEKDAVHETAKMSPKKLAQNAYRIAVATTGPSLSTLKLVTTACAMTGQWRMAQKLLRSVQRMVVVESERLPNGKAALCDLQSRLLRECAQQGNVTAALWLVNDIQRFATTQIHSNSSPVVPFEHNMEGIPHSVTDEMSLEQTGVHMRAANWVSLMKAARQSGHWRVCVNTLQFLRPYVAETTPSHCGTEEDELQREKYEKLVPALVHATACLEVRSQYAWAVRSIKDWISWSGRSLPPRAVLSVIRVLSARGRGDEVKDLLSDIIHHPAILVNNEDGEEEMLYSGACTALHRNGLYDDADEIYVSGVSNGSLGFSFGPGEEAMVLDLHGLNVALAHSAVRVAMRHLTTMPKRQEKLDMMIITGRGRNSALHLRPVLRPEIQRMLLEEFYPPLNTVSVPGNMGALLVNADDISRWQEHQEGQKGARMLAIAAAIKDLSSSRLRKSIALSIEANTKDLE
ncbi:MAG: hypothetical protein SGBAC_011311 [Bacillariaceae sp.]